jgi:hypothetical protein
MNAVKARLSQLKVRNYVRKAKPEEDYWFDFARRKLNKIRQIAGDELFLILYGSSSAEEDFFVIPYEALKHVLTEDNLVEAKPGDHRVRWIGRIRDNKLAITHSGTEIDVTPYKGNLGLLDVAVDGIQAGVDLIPEEAADDEGDDGTSPYIPKEGDWRSIVSRQIKDRRGQKQFRDALRKRYGNLCLVTGCELLDIVEAAHIKPYRGAPDHHPANGLLLRADVHTLFDLDLIGVEPETLIVRVHPSAQAAGYGVFDGVKLKCVDLRPSQEALAVRWEAYRQKCRPQAKAVV